MIHRNATGILLRLVDPDPHCSLDQQLHPDLVDRVAAFAHRGRAQRIKLECSCQRRQPGVVDDDLAVVLAVDVNRLAAFVGIKILHIDAEGLVTYLQQHLGREYRTTDFFGLGKVRFVIGHCF